MMLRRFKVTITWMVLIATAGASHFAWRHVYAQDEVAPDAGSNTTVVGRPQPSDAQRALWAATEELRGLIDAQKNRLTENGSDRHLMTATMLGRAYANLGQFEDARAIRAQLDQSGNKRLKKAARSVLASIEMAQTAQGLYASNLEQLDSRDRVNAALAAIHQGDLDSAKTILQSAMTPSDAKGFDVLGLAVANSDLAIVASWLSRPNDIDAALRRFRAIFETSAESSDRPLDEDTAWLKKANTPASLFLQTLASCGQVESLESIWSQVNQAESLEPLGRTWLASGIAQRLVHAGKREAGIRFAQAEYDGSIPLEVYEELIVQAVRENETELALQSLAQMMDAVDNRTFYYATPPSDRLDLDNAVRLDQTGRGLLAYAKVLTRLQNAEDQATAAKVARAFIRCVDEFNRAFETELDVDEMRQLRSWNQPLNRFSVEPVIGTLPDNEVLEFANRHYQFLTRTQALLKGSTAMKSVLAHEKVMAKLGQVPQNLDRFDVRDRLEIAVDLREAGNLEAANQVFEATRVSVLGPVSRNVVSGSLGGRVVYRSIASRYRVASLSGTFDRFEDGIQVVDAIEHEGERIDGYRVLGKTLAERNDMGQAIEWAGGLSDEDLRLAAYVGILEAQVATLFPQSDQESSYRQELERLGRPLSFLIRGC